MFPASLTAHIGDLHQTFSAEADGRSVYDCTREAILEGSIALDARNFINPQTASILSRARIIKRFGSPMQGVQYYILTPKGYDILFPVLFPN